MKYFNKDNNEITEEQYNTLVNSGKDFEMYNPIVDQEAENLKPNSGRVTGLKQLSDADQATKDANDAQWIIDNPWTTQLAPAKEYKINSMRKKIRNKFEKYVDRHYAKASRRGTDTVPDAIKTYANELDTFWDEVKDEVNALSTIEEVQAYKIREKTWPTDPEE